MDLSKEVQELREEAQKALLRAIANCAGQNDAKRAEELAGAYAAVTQGEKAPGKVHSA